jgi:hypothetical protein
MHRDAVLTETLILRKPPVPEFWSMLTTRLLGGVHWTRRYWMSILPPSIGAICTEQRKHLSELQATILHEPHHLQTLSMHATTSASDEGTVEKLAKLSRKQ